MEEEGLRTALKIRCLLTVSSEDAPSLSRSSFQIPIPSCPGREALFGRFLPSLARELAASGVVPGRAPLACLPPTAPRPEPLREAAAPPLLLLSKRPAQERTAVLCFSVICLCSFCSLCSFVPFVLSVPFLRGFEL